MHLQIEFFVTTTNDATATRLGTVFSEDMERLKGRFNAGSSVDTRRVYMVSTEELGLTPAPTTLTPTFNADATLNILEMKHTSGHMIPFYQSRAGPSTELFKPAWYSYRATLASKNESSASIDLSFVPTYSRSTVSVKKGNLGFGSSTDHRNLGVFSSNVTIVLDPGSYSLVLLVTNGDAGVKLEYDLQVIFPYPTCPSTALGPW